MEIHWRGGTCLRCPERAEIHRRVSRDPPLEESLDRRVQYGVLEVGMIEEPVAAHGDVARRDSLERATGEIACEDDVHDVLRGKRAHGRDRVDERDRAFEREPAPDPPPSGRPPGSASTRLSPELTPPPGRSQYSP